MKKIISGSEQLMSVSASEQLRVLELYVSTRSMNSSRACYP